MDGNTYWRRLSRLASRLSRRRGPRDAAIDRLTRQGNRLRSRVGALEAAGLPGRVDLLENEIQELRRLGVRVAELSDLVAELIVHESRARGAEYRAVVAKYLEAG